MLMQGTANHSPARESISQQRVRQRKVVAAGLRHLVAQPRGVIDSPTPAFAITTIFQHIALGVPMNVIATSIEAIIQFRYRAGREADRAGLSG